MLTLKAPIQLNIGSQTLTTSCEAFGQRIMGNYNILDAKITPRNLLLLLTAPPEVLEEEGGMTTLVSNHTRVDQSHVTVDVVNNVVNRILLDGSTSFTYQDQVYITSILNRLGITDVEQFMTQVRQLRVETENTNYMTRLYRSELERMLRYQSEHETSVLLPAPIRSEEESSAATDPRVELSMQILNRLGTSRLYETLHLFQKNVTRGENYIQHNELRLAEHLRFSNEVSLAQIKQQLFAQPTIDLTHHVNHYETGAILEAPQTEEAVLSQAAAAALVSAVDNTVTEVINRPNIRHNQWMQLGHAIWQTAVNAVSRFERYHNEYETASTAVQLNMETAWNRYAAEMRQYLTLRQYQNQQIDQYISKTAVSRGDVNMTHLTQLQEENEFLAPERMDVRISRERLRTTIQTLMEQQMMGTAGEEPSGAEREIIRHRELRLTQERLREFQQEAQEIQKVKRAQGHTEVTLPVAAQTSQRLPEPALPPMELTDREAEEQAPELLVEQLQQIDQHNKTILQQIQSAMQIPKMQAPQVPVADLKRTMRDSLRALEEPELVLREIYEEGERQRAQKSPYTPREEAILRQASPADRALYERVLAYEKDPHGALERGLVSFANPGALEAQVRQIERNVPQVLEHLDTVRETQEIHEETETVLQKMIQHTARGTREEEQRAALERGLVSSTNPRGLEAQVRQLETQVPQVLEHLNTVLETQEVHEETETVLKKLLYHTARGISVEEHRTAPGAVRIVHKQNAPDISEDVLQRLEQKNTQEIVTTENNESMTRRNTSHTEITNQEHKVVQRTTEDITELVNRTLAKQMRTISDQVYRQMEKRLQMERSRRGRF